MPEEKSNLSATVSDRRRSERRILVNVPVEVSLISPSKHPLTEKTFIEDVSDFGCRFSTHGAVQQGNTVSVRLLAPDGRPFADEEPRLYEIMWVARKERSYTSGARLLRGEKIPTEDLAEKNG